MVELHQKVSRSPSYVALCNVKKFSVKLIDGYVERYPVVYRWKRDDLYMYLFISGVEDRQLLVVSDHQEVEFGVGMCFEMDEYSGGEFFDDSRIWLTELLHCSASKLYLLDTLTFDRYTIECCGKIDTYHVIRYNDKLLRECSKNFKGIDVLCKILKGLELKPIGLWGA